MFCVRGDRLLPKCAHCVGGNNNVFIVFKVVLFTAVVKPQHFVVSRVTEKTTK